MKKTILLVDDETYILQSLKRLLSEDGYHVLTSSSGSDGMELLKSQSVQVIISDQRMPGMTGSDFLKQVRELFPDKVCMILSAYIDFEALKEAINEGAIYKFISKPWQDSVLVQYVRDAFVMYTKKNEIKQSLIEPGYYDALTNLQNRFSFYESLSQLILKVKKNYGHFAIVYFDIDRFSDINAVIGQKKGDMILRELAVRLKKLIKDEKKLARLGNDEFVVVINNMNALSNPDSIIKALSSTIKKPMDIEGNKYHLTVSMGICRYPEDGHSVDLLMQRASLALKQCQALGGNGIQQYTADMGKISEAESFIEDDLYQALEKRQFLLYYQPVFNLDKSKVVGMEALIRWQHPKQGLLLPGKFLNVCETTNLIVPIGAWVLRTACKQMKLWHDLGFPDLVLAVNLSIRQFNHPKLLDLIIDVLETTQLSPHCLALEITETLIMRSPEEVIVVLNALRGLGVQLYLDDFGTGYSSLSYLRQFPFTCLKVDQSFVRDMVQSQTGEAIVDTIISLSKILDITVVAEGVETEEQLALLKRKKCDFIQGFLYARPLPAQGVVKFLMNQKKLAGD